MAHELEKILDYKMTQQEAMAYKLCLIWQDLCSKIFPGRKFSHLRSKGDPRKSEIFRYCYTLINDTKGIIPDNQYRLYLQSQLSMLKSFNDGNVLISPRIITGIKAWKRWKYWKYHYDRIEETNSIETAVPEHLVIEELRKTYDFLSSQCSKLSKDWVKERVADGTMKKWLFVARVSPYYPILSPVVKSDNFGIDDGVYRKSISKNVEDFFKRKFAYEF